MTRLFLLLGTVLLPPGRMQLRGHDLRTTTHVRDEAEDGSLRSTTRTRVLVLMEVLKGAPVGTR